MTDRQTAVVLTSNHEAIYIAVTRLAAALNFTAQFDTGRIMLEKNKTVTFTRYGDAHTERVPGDKRTKMKSFSRC